VNPLSDCCSILQESLIPWDRFLVQVDNQFVAGEYTVFWDGNDKNGKLVSSGLYIYKLRADNFVDVKKMILLR